MNQTELDSHATFLIFKSSDTWAINFCNIGFSAFRRAFLGAAARALHSSTTPPLPPTHHKSG